MSRKNQIDELFRHGLGQKGMEFHPEYWEQMEGLIDAKKKKSLPKLFWLIIPVIIIAPLLYFTLGNSPGQLTDNAPVKSVSQVPVKDAPQTAPATKASIARAKNVHKEQIEASSTLPSSSEISPSSSPIAKSSPNPPSFTPIEKVEETPIVSEIQEIENPTFSSPLDPLSVSSKTFAIYPPSAPKGPSKPLDQESIKKAYRPSPLHLYISPYIQYVLLNPRYESEIDNWKRNYEKVNNAKEYGLQLRLDYQRFSLLGGLGFKQWSEQTNYVSQLDHYTYDTSFRLIQRNYQQRPDGSYIALLEAQYDTASHYTTDTVSNPNARVDFRYITLPIQLQYTLGFGRFEYFAGAGLTFNILSSHQGQYSTAWKVESGKAPEMMLNNPAKLFVNRSFIQMNMLLGMRYCLNRKLALEAQLNYQRGLSSIMKNYNQQMDAFGVKAGLNVKLF